MARGILSAIKPSVREEIDVAVQHEALVNVAFAGIEAAILCPYDVRQMPHDVTHADRTHPVVVDARGRRPSPT